MAAHMRTCTPFSDGPPGRPLHTLSGPLARLSRPASGAVPAGHAGGARVCRLHSYFRRHELMVHVNIRHIAAAKFAVLVLGTAHCLGCLWFLLARWARFSARPNDESWLEQFKAASGIGYGCDGDASAVRPPPARAHKKSKAPNLVP